MQELRCEFPAVEPGCRVSFEKSVKPGLIEALEIIKKESLTS
jgi:hypothetical protein